MVYPSKLATGTILGSIAFAVLSHAAIADDNLNPNDLLNLSLEQLTNIEITSVSKKSEKASEAAAAIYVITQDDIKRSGMTSIPELLRMVPGLSVAQAGAHDWAITSRGTSNQFANKLLVLIDGRSVYTPLFSGVYWDVQDVVLQDIERIEVIRGPGATLWGANAVNGVINIITKNSKDTQGGLVSVTAGNVERSLNDVRYGAKISDNTYARAYAKYDDRDEFKLSNGGRAHDSWNKAQSGFRADGSNGGDINYTVQGDIYSYNGGLPVNLPANTPSLIQPAHLTEEASGGNLLGRANYKQSTTSEWTLQTYFDVTHRRNIVSDTIYTFDVDLQHTWTPQERHEIVWGIGYRLISADSNGTFYNFQTPESRTDNLFSSFIQDKIGLVPDKFYLTLGSKFEHNNYTGFELQPSARLTWLVANNQTLWTSASHAVRTPNRFMDDGTLLLSSLGGGVYAAAVGNHATLSEELNAYEMGYRIQPIKSVSLDATTFFNDYSKLITNSIGAPTAINIPGYGPTVVIPVSPINGNSGTTSGVEIATNWTVTDKWQLGASYTRLNFSLKNPEQPGFTVKGNSPQDQFNIHSELNLPHDVMLSNAVYYVSRLEGLNVPAYTRFDSKVSWKAMENLELSLVGQNIFHTTHQEFVGFLYHNNSDVPRSFYGNITWKF